VSGTRRGEVAAKHAIAVGLGERQRRAYLEAERARVAGRDIDALDLFRDRRDVGGVHPQTLARGVECAHDHVALLRPGERGEGVEHLLVAARLVTCAHRAIRSPGRPGA
jgi:hypothetical protein